MLCQKCHTDPLEQYWPDFIKIQSLRGLALYHPVSTQLRRRCRFAMPLPVNGGQVAGLQCLPRWTVGVLQSCRLFPVERRPGYRVAMPSPSDGGCVAKLQALPRRTAARLQSCNAFPVGRWACYKVASPSPSNGGRVAGFQALPRWTAKASQSCRSFPVGPRRWRVTGKGRFLYQRPRRADWKARRPKR